MRQIWNSDNGDGIDSGQPIVAVAIDKDKGSQIALKWSVDNLIPRGHAVTLLHVKKPSHHHHNHHHSDEVYAKELFLPFRCFCTRKDIKCRDVILEDSDITKAIIEFVSINGVENLVVGTPTRNSFIRFKTTDVPTVVAKGAPDFCTVYVVSKGKAATVRNASRQAPVRAQEQNKATIKHESTGRAPISFGSTSAFSNPTLRSDIPHSFEDSIRSPFTRGGRTMNGKLYGELSVPDTDISFVSSSRPSMDELLPSLYEDMNGHRPPQLYNCSDSNDRSTDMMQMPMKTVETHSLAKEYSTFSQDAGFPSSWPAQPMDDVDTEMKRLRLELKHTMDMFSTARKEAMTANKKAGELHRWKEEEEQKLQEVRLAEETTLAIVEREKAKCKAAIEAAEAAQRLAELEAQKRITAEKMASREAEERKKAMDALANKDLRYRRYSIEEIEVATENFSEKRKIGEGGYGPVYKGHLDHTPVAIKVLRSDADQGKSQFQQEVEVLSCIRHPNMVLLLGACPEFGCLVYEYMANGSLEDCLFRKGNDIPILSWQLRFRIAAEIATGLLFLHQTKPEPLVHRDLKPGNILLDCNLVSKISDVGLARLVPPSVADNVTQCRMTSTAGTFCYIDPEYQQTGLLSTKSDVYSLGILLLQIITGKPPMGLTHHVEYAIENGKFKSILDQSVQDWPVEEALTFAKLSLQCAELRRKDRPNLGKVVLPELNRLRALASDNMHTPVLRGIRNDSPVSMNNVNLSGPQYESGSRYSITLSSAGKVGLM